MSTLKARLETHPINNLNKVIRSVKSVLAPTLALSKGKKRHSKATLVDHILKLDKLGLLKTDIPLYKAPKRTKKEVNRTPASAQEIKDSLMVPGKYSKAEIKSGKALVKNQPKKAVKSEQNLAYEEPQPSPKAPPIEDKKQALIKKLMTPRAKSKKPRSEKQKANDKRLGEASKARAKARTKK